MAVQKQLFGWNTHYFQKDTPYTFAVVQPRIPYEGGDVTVRHYVDGELVDTLTNLDETIAHDIAYAKVAKVADIIQRKPAQWAVAK